MENTVIIPKDGYLNIARTLDCGQAFRWKEKDGIWQGVAKGSFLKVKETVDSIVFYTTEEEFNKVWFDYFDLGRDYSKICRTVSQNDVLKETVKYGKGIRILKQDSFEALCSFIISQNNNIPRIKGIIERLCQNFGERLSCGEYAFPTAQRLALLTVDDLAVIRSGFRAKYIIAAAKSVASGEIPLKTIEQLPLDNAREYLTRIYGVGNKVADCTLLFGMGRLDAFPKDVWIKRAIKVLFNGNFPTEVNEYAGVAQQFLFFYARETKLNI